MTADDIAAHRGDWVEPISTPYRGVEVATIPPNSQGITALIALNVLADARLADGATAVRVQAPRPDRGAQGRLERT